MSTPRGRICNFKTACRICLQYTGICHKDLCSPISDEDESPLIFEALNDIIGEKIVKIDGYPSGVCDTCLDILSTTYNLKNQYFKSKQILEKALPTLLSYSHNTFYKRIFCKSIDTDDFKVPLKRRQKETGKLRKIESKRLCLLKQPLKLFASRGVQTDLTEVKIDDKERMPNVELLLGETSYDIKDLVIVEDESSKTNDAYKGFLQNLGSVVSASFAGKEGAIKSVSKSRKCTEIEITPLSDNVDVGLLEPFEELASEPVNMSITCRHCKKSFNSASYVKKHMPICEKFNNLQCYLCDEKKLCMEDLVLHVKNKHSIGKQLETNPMLEVDKKRLTCKICKTVLTNMRRLRYHMLRHKGNQFACEECGKMFLTLHVLNNHKTRAHQNKTVEVCPVCAKTFTYKGALLSHMKLHSNKLNYICSFCSKKFRFHYAKAAHERTHTGEKPYRCRFCQKRFRSHSDWKKHERSVHTGERPHKCQLCDLAFVTKCYLKRHMLQHEGDFECQVCNKNFVDSEILELHFKTKHTIRITDGSQEQIIIEETVQEFNENEDFEYFDDQYQTVSNIYVNEDQTL